jgi:hypothetical protein
MHRIVRTTLLAGLTGALSVSVAWAGVGLVPVPAPAPQPEQVSALLPDGSEAPSAESTEQAGTERAGAEAAEPTAAALPGLAGGQMLVGASKTSLVPRPEDMKDRFPDARWEQDGQKCKPLAPEYIQRLIADTATEVDHLASSGSAWPENPNCLYMGGYGLGPMNPITTFDSELGLWVRALAIGDGQDLIVLTVIDGEGWLWDYANKCDDCGIKQISESLAADPELAARGMTPASFNLHATHSHTSMDFLGGWGFVPDWYMAQATDTIKQTVKDAVLAMEPAVVEVGVEDARQHNSERRSTYRSAEEPELNWLRAVAAGDQTSKTKTKGKPAPAEAPRTIATMGAFAAHPVTQDADGGVAHADWPGYFNARAEERFGGVGLHFMTGLGNLTGAKSEQHDEAGNITRISTGTALADLVPEVGTGRTVDSTDLRLSRTTWRQPVTNAPLDALGTPGLFDRQFDAMPASVSVGKSSNAPCTSAAPQSVELPATVAKIGDDVVLTTGPGELFANLTNTIKEKNADAVTFPLAQTNDSLGYMPQSFELNPVGQQGLGFRAGGVLFVNYEDSYAIDRCVGDMALETTLKALAGLK